VNYPDPKEVGVVHAMIVYPTSNIKFLFKKLDSFVSIKFLLDSEYHMLYISYRKRYDFNVMRRFIPALKGEAFCGEDFVSNQPNRKLIWRTT